MTSARRDAPPSAEELLRPDSIRARARAYEARHPPRAEAPPPDPGRVLSRSRRPDGTELRVSMHTYEGKPFVRVAVWQRGAGDAWWPVKGKGVAVKVRELPVVAVALADAMDAAEEGDGR